MLAIFGGAGLYGLDGLAARGGELTASLPCHSQENVYTPQDPVLPPGQGGSCGNALA